MVSARTFFAPRRPAWSPIAFAPWSVVLLPDRRRVLRLEDDFRVTNRPDLSGFRSVVVYCRRFATVFSTPELAS